VAVASSAEIPQAMVAFATEAMQAALRDPLALKRALGETLTEPKANVWFSGEEGEPAGGVRLDRRTRMLFDSHHVFINGESFRAAGRDAQLMRTLADQRYLEGKDMARLSDDARELVTDWYQAGWLYADQ
jgi:50S ribosomal protein L16 3-hydroxylase